MDPMNHELSFSGNDPDDHGEVPPDFQEAVDAVIACGNKLLETKSETSEVWDVASGILCGAIHFWLFSRQPCKRSVCQPCSSVNTAERRMKALLKEVNAHGEDSEYFHTPHDQNVGSA